MMADVRCMMYVKANTNCTNCTNIFIAHRGHGLHRFLFILNNELNELHELFLMTVLHKTALLESKGWFSLEVS